MRPVARSCWTRSPVESHRQQGFPNGHPPTQSSADRAQRSSKCKQHQWPHPGPFSGSSGRQPFSGKYTHTHPILGGCPLSVCGVPWGDPLSSCRGGSHPACGADHPHDGSGQGLRRGPRTRYWGIFYLPFCCRKPLCLRR